MHFPRKLPYLYLIFISNINIFIFNNIHDKEIPFSGYAIRKQKVFNFLTDNKVKILQKKIKFDFLADTNKTHYNFKFKLDSKGFSTNVLLDSKWG